jgi:photosystem II stability/assembly factor-like uncharacterized protein
MQRFRYLAVILIACISCKNESAQTNVTPGANESLWKVIGPGGGGGVFLPTISPFDKNLVLTHCDMTGAYISNNGGNEWRMFNLWTVPNDFEFDPADSNIIYTATHGYRYSEDRGSGLSMLYRSEDRGKHWRIIYPDVSKIKNQTSHLQNQDLLPSQIVEGAFDGSIEKVEVDPLDHRKIYLGLSPLQSFMSKGNNNPAADSVMFVLSIDEGKSWTKMANLPGRHIFAIFPRTDAHPNEVLVFTDRSIARIYVADAQVHLAPLPAEHVVGVEGSKEMIYLLSRFANKNGTTTGGIYVSKNLGASWNPANTGLFSNLAAGTVPSFARGLAVCETMPNVAYVSTFGQREKGKRGDDIYGIFKTTNGGANWEPVFMSCDTGYISNNYEGAWLDRSYDPGWGGSPFGLGVAPTDPDICYAVDNGRCYKTADGGKSWKQVYSHEMSDGSYESSGLDVTTCYGVHFDPFDKNHFFVCYTDMGLFNTFNGGKSWFHSVTNIPKDLQNTCYDLVFDPQTKGRVWSVWANAHDLPRVKMFGAAGFDHYSGGVAVSDDDGRTWRMSSNGLPKNSICTNILLETSRDTTKQTLYVSVFAKGIYKSEDGGKNWVRKNEGLGNNLFAWELRRSSQGRIFALFARGLKGTNTIDGEIYYSDDKAETWKKLTLRQGVNGPHDLLIDSANSDIMYVSCWPRRDGDHDTYGGVIKTEDGGLSWKNIFDSSMRVNSAGADPSHPGTIVINTFQNAAYFTKDAGNTWSRIKGYRFKWGQRAIPDPYNSGMVYLTTYGGSVFYGPLDDKRDSFTDIVNMPAEWW